MWSLSFPAPLKEYIDCIVMDGKTIALSDDKLDGLLDDKNLEEWYIFNLSGANINWMSKILNKGLNYVEDIMKNHRN